MIFGSKAYRRAVYGEWFDDDPLPPKWERPLRWLAWACILAGILYQMFAT